MSVHIDEASATQVLKHAGKMADEDNVSQDWENHVRTLSHLCENAPKTHIAFLGTALLAKATNPAVDVFSLHVKADTPGAYSARSVATAVLVPNARQLGIHLGVTGREPLNNQPYFRYHVVSRDMTVSPAGRKPLECVCHLLHILAALKSQKDRLQALASFIKVRRSYLVSPEPLVSLPSGVTLQRFRQLISDFVAANSEGGRRAQAVAAGLLGLIDGPERVKSGRINDPDKDFPGDVALLTPDGSVYAAFEVRDKFVTDDDVRIIIEKVGNTNIFRAGVIAVAPGQPSLDEDAAQQTADASDLVVAIFVGWDDFCRRVFLWPSSERQLLIDDAHAYIYSRLIALECSADAQRAWRSLW